MWKIPDANLGTIRIPLVGGIIDIVRPLTASFIISPNVKQVQPMTYLVYGSATEVEWRPRNASRAEGRVQNDNSISCCGSAGELCITQQTIINSTGPKV